MMMMHPTTPSSPQNFPDTVETPYLVHHADISALHERAHELPAEDSSYQDAESSPVPASSRATSQERPENLSTPMGGAPKMTHVPRAVLENMTHLPRDQAAATLGLCMTTFKKVCRRSGMLKWPYRRGWVRRASDTTDENTNTHTNSPSPDPSTTSTSSALMSQGEHTSGACSSLAAAPPLAQSSYWRVAEDSNFLPAILDYLDALDAPPPPQIASGSASGGLAGPGDAPASGAMRLSQGDVYAIVGIEPDRAVGGEGWRL